MILDEKEIEVHLNKFWLIRQNIDWLKENFA